jgi:hypothetical protein
LFYADAGPHLIKRGIAPAASGSRLHALLETSIAGLHQLDSEPFSQPAEIEDDLVSIEDFFYRGRAALDRAIALKNEIRTRGGAPTADDVDELFALLDLAAAE